MWECPRLGEDWQMNINVFQINQINALKNHRKKEADQSNFGKQCSYRILKAKDKKIIIYKHSALGKFVLCHFVRKGKRLFRLICIFIFFYFLMFYLFHEPWDHDLSRSPTLNRWSHQGAPICLILIILSVIGNPLNYLK